MTSAEMLQRTYLRFIEEEATAKRARAQILPGDWSTVKRAVLRGAPDVGTPYSRFTKVEAIDKEDT